MIVLPNPLYRNYYRCYKILCSTRQWHIKCPRLIYNNIIIIHIAGICNCYYRRFFRFFIFHFKTLNSIGCSLPSPRKYCLDRNLFYWIPLMWCTDWKQCKIYSNTIKYKQIMFELKYFFFRLVFLRIIIFL